MDASFGGGGHALQLQGKKKLRKHVGPEYAQGGHRHKKTTESQKHGLPLQCGITLEAILTGFMRHGRFSSPWTMVVVEIGVGWELQRTVSVLWWMGPGRISDRSSPGSATFCGKVRNCVRESFLEHF